MFRAGGADQGQMMLMGSLKTIAKGRPNTKVNHLVKSVSRDLVTQSVFKEDYSHEGISSKISARQCDCPSRGGALIGALFYSPLAFAETIIREVQPCPPDVPTPFNYLG